MLSCNRENAHNGSSLMCGGENVNAIMEEETEKTDDISRATLIWRAIKLPMYIKSSFDPCNCKSLLFYLNPIHFLKVIEFLIFDLSYFCQNFVFCEQVGTAAAYWQTGLYSSARYLKILASYVLVIAWLNLRSIN